MDINNLVQMWNYSKGLSKIAVIDEERTYSYDELYRKANALASYLVTEAGVKYGDRVGIIIPNKVEFVISYFAVLSIGAIVLPINTRLKANEYKYIIEDSKTTCIIINNEQWDNVKDVVQQTKRIIGIGIKADNVVDFNLAVISKESIDNEFILKADPDDIAVIMYTSGTTGMPKGAMMTHKNILFNCLSCNNTMRFNNEDIHLIAVPLFHVTGLNSQLIVSIYNKSTIVLIDKYKTEKLHSALIKYPITVFLGVPTMFRLLLLKTKIEELRKNTRLKTFGYAGAPMDKDTILRLNKVFPNIKLHNFYGLTETSSITTVLPAKDAVKYPDSVGFPAPGVQIKTVDANGNETIHGEIGELWIKGDNIVKGYYNKPDATKNNITKGWLHSGDFASLDKEGRVYLKGRSVELINRGGEKIYPIEIENILLSNPKVLDAAAFPVSDNVMGEEIGTCIVLKDGATATAEEIRDHCKKYLADFKVPKYVKFVTELPRNPGGKVIKSKLKEMI